MKATQEHLEFLDNLRESGVTNMYGASPYLVAEFGLRKSDASAILSEWMKTFSERKRTPHKNTGAANGTYTNTHLSRNPQRQRS